MQIYSPFLKAQDICNCLYKGLQASNYVILTLLQLKKILKQLTTQVIAFLTERCIYKADFSSQSICTKANIQMQA